MTQLKRQRKFNRIAWLCCAMVLFVDPLRAEDTPPKPVVESAAPLPALIASQFFPILPISAGDKDEPQLLPITVNRDLSVDQSKITRAIVFIHDLTRNANDGVAMLTTLAGADNGTTFIIAPQFPLDIDIARFATHLPNKGSNVARWPMNAWQSGGDSTAKAPIKGVSSFTALDLMLMFLGDKQRFPAIQQIVIAGHGMGGDFVQRYAAAGKAPDILAQENLTVRFMVANANSYLYFTPSRPAGEKSTFTIPDATKCPDYNSYPLGLNDLSPYARRIGMNAIRLRYPERRIMYLMSDKISPDTFLDMGCAATLQGADRLARGRNFERYLMTLYGDTARTSQSFTQVPKAGYDPVALFGSYCGMAMLFGDGECRTTLIK